jgi:hypothetical protein
MHNHLPDEVSMRKTFWLVSVFLFTLPLSLPAETLDIVPGLVLKAEFPGDRWSITREAPSFLVEEIAEHLEHELLAQGKKVEPAALRAAAQKRLAANEAYIVNPTSGAYLAIDFSPLREGEAAPGKKAIAASARYAGEGLVDEEGATEVSQKSSKTELQGASVAYRVDASFRMHDEPRKFIGIIGFRKPYWFYLYYTDPLRDAADAREMEQILQSIVLSAGGV